MTQTATTKSTTRAKHRIPPHPPLAHVVIGSYATAGVCDTISVLGFAGDDGTYLNHAAMYALMVGTGTMALAIIAGLFDRVQNTRPGGYGRRIVNIHAAIMVTLGVLSIINITIRESSVSESHTPIGIYVLTVLGLILMVIGGRLGGIAVYRLGAGTPAKQGSQPAPASGVPAAQQS